MTEYVFDTNADGVADSVAYDTNDDGYAEAIAFDRNQDGYFDGYAVDTNADGVMDTFIADNNQNGVVDAVGVDYNADGVVDSVVFDANENGTDDGLEATLYPTTATIGPPTSPDPTYSLMLGLAAATNTATFGTPDSDGDGWDDNQDRYPTDGRRS